MCDNSLLPHIPMPIPNLSSSPKSRVCPTKRPQAHHNLPLHFRAFPIRGFQHLFTFTSPHHNASSRHHLGPNPPAPRTPHAEDHSARFPISSHFPECFRKQTVHNILAQHVKVRGKIYSQSDGVLGKERASAASAGECGGDDSEEQGFVS